MRNKSRTSARELNMTCTELFQKCILFFLFCMMYLLDCTGANSPESLGKFAMTVISGFGSEAARSRSTKLPTAEQTRIAKAVGWRRTQKKRRVSCRFHLSTNFLHVGLNRDDAGLRTDVKTHPREGVVYYNCQCKHSYSLVCVVHITIFSLACLYICACDIRIRICLVYSARDICEQAGVVVSMCSRQHEAASR